MDLEDAIEDAEEKGWSETLIFHDIFNILREKEIETDRKVSSCTMCICMASVVLPAAETEFDV